MTTPPPYPEAAAYCSKLTNDGLILLALASLIRCNKDIHEEWRVSISEELEYRGEKLIEGIRGVL